MSGRFLGTLLMGIGVLAVLAGVLVMTGALGWFGRLPGDIRIQGGGVRVFIPITTMLVLSILLTAVVAIIRRLF